MKHVRKGNVMDREEKKPVKSWEEYFEQVIGSVESRPFVKPEELPAIDLYMDQVTTFMGEHFETAKRHESDKLLTKTMINNYTKSGLLPSPEKKKYSRDHMYLLLFIYYLKSMLSIEDIRMLLEPMAEQFYKTDSDVNIKQIYEEIFAICSDTARETVDGMKEKFERSNACFSDTSDEREKEFLKMFSFISMLSYDVYLKKQVIVKIIDDFSKEYGEGKDKKKK